LIEHGLTSTPTQYTGDGYYRSKDPSNSTKVLKEQGFDSLVITRRGLQAMDGPQELSLSVDLRPT